MGSQPVISVVVCTYNRAHLLEQCIQSLLIQDLDRKFFEIIVVDNASTDGTQAILAKYQDESVFRSIHEPVPGLSKARNTGWKFARGQFIGYIDDDAVACVRWLRSALWCFENIFPQPDALTGPIQLLSEVVLPEWIDDELKRPLGYLDWGSQCFRISFEDRKIVGANCFFSKAILCQLGGFSEDLGRKKKLLLSGEEVQLQREIEESGGAVWYHPDVSVEHFVPEERTKPSWYYHRNFWGGVSDSIMASIHSRQVSETSAVTPAISSCQPAFGGRRDQLLRVTMNFFHSLGIAFSKTKVIRARIYMSYVCGYLYGLFSRYTKRI